MPLFFSFIFLFQLIVERKTTKKLTRYYRDYKIYYNDKIVVEKNLSSLPHRLAFFPLIHTREFFVSFFFFGKRKYREKRDILPLSHKSVYVVYDLVSIILARFTSSVRRIAYLNKWRHWAGIILQDKYLFSLKMTLWRLPRLVEKFRHVETFNFILSKTSEIFVCVCVSSSLWSKVSSTKGKKFIRREKEIIQK